MTRDAKRLGEFELIAKYFAPLARGERGALGLTDDAALFEPKAGHDLVLTTDAVVAGVHFLENDPPETIAQKALGVNLSDLAAKGARPRVYLLTIALPRAVDEPWIKSFAAGLKRAQARFGIGLVGGDTVATPGPLTISVTAVGEVPRGRMLTRGGAKAGDDIWVTGTIGDAALGLRAAHGENLRLDDKQRAALIARYRIPEPRSGLGPRLLGVAHACLDVSDGLIADLGHMAAASRVGVEIAVADVPLSSPAAAAVEADRAAVSELLTAGDDYELAIAAPPAKRKQMADLAAAAKTKLTRIGRVVRGRGVVARGAGGATLPLSRKGFTHF
jgi:thiamine-monophosphate kinase